MEWTEPRAPDGANSYYDHVETDTPFGVIRIEWKEDDSNPDGLSISYDCTLPWNNPDGSTVFVSEDSLEYAKIRVKEEFAKLAARLVATPVMRHKVRWDIQKRCRAAIKRYDAAVEEWKDFTPVERGGSPMEAWDEAMNDAEVQLLDSILDVMQDYGVTFP